eukprot:3716728-Pleurochrysis_carterae.AAC.1
MAGRCRASATHLCVHLCRRKLFLQWKQPFHTRALISCTDQICVPASHLAPFCRSLSLYANASSFLSHFGIGAVPKNAPPSRSSPSPCASPLYF